MPMTLENTLVEKLSEWQPPPGRQEFHAAADGWSVTVAADRSDALGCLLWELTLRRQGEANIDVSKWAATAAERVSGLMEALKVVEVDTIRKEAQLRSESPRERGEKRLYYELLLRSREAVLRRYQTAVHSSHREQITFALTHEALAKLAADVAASA
jgi:hypothetical protein